MNRKMLLAGALLALMAAGVFAQGGNPFIGLWNGTGNAAGIGLTLVFTDTSLTMSSKTGSGTGPYTRNGNTATIRGIDSTNATAVVSGSSLTLTWGGSTFTLVRDDGLLPLDGVWSKTDGFGPPTITISGNTATLVSPLTFAETGNVSGSWAPRYNEAVSKGMIKVGDTFIRNIQNTGTDSRGRTTWSCEYVYLPGGNNARLEWRKGVITKKEGIAEFPGLGIYRKIDGYGIRG